MKITKLFLNIEHEEKWINDMSAKGYRLIEKDIFSYEFEKNESGRHSGIMLIKGAYQKIMRSSCVF